MPENYASLSLLETMRVSLTLLKRRRTRHICTTGKTASHMTIVTRIIYVMCLQFYRFPYSTYMSCASLQESVNSARE